MSIPRCAHPPCNTAFTGCGRSVGNPDWVGIEQRRTCRRCKRVWTCTMHEDGSWVVTPFADRKSTPLTDKQCEFIAKWLDFAYVVARAEAQGSTGDLTPCDAMSSAHEGLIRAATRDYSQYRSPRRMVRWAVRAQIYFDLSLRKYGIGRAISQTAEPQFQTLSLDRMQDSDSDEDRNLYEKLMLTFADPPHEYPGDRHRWYQIAGLSADLAKLLENKYAEDLDDHDQVPVFGVTRSTIQRRVQAAKDQLRNALLAEERELSHV